ncbi:tRNA lysidine(34) synthetase TilS [bacterium]|nr:tRNA lysidine(34) synthetase TilS [bacterium]
MQRRLPKSVVKDSKFLLAVSGGPDSMGLLAILFRELRVPLNRVIACYVDHGIRRTTDLDKAVIRDFTDRNGVAFKVLSVDVPKLAKERKLSLEAAARKLRYEALQREAKKSGCDSILTGHTMDDSAETVLMKMRSGAPWYEWTGIPAVRGQIIRPLIDVYRYEIREYLDEAGIIPAQDETNFELRFQRNALRLQLQNSSYWTRERIRKLAREGARLESYLAGLRSIAAKVTNYESKQVFTDCESLAIKRILTYFSRIEFLPVEAAWANLTGDSDRRLPSAVRRQISDCIQGSSDNSVIRLPRGYVMEKRGATVWVFAEQRVRVNERVGEGTAVIGALSRKLALTLESTPELRERESFVLDGRVLTKSLTLRNWQAGDRMKIRGRPTKKISDLLSQDKINPAERSCLLVLADEDGPLVLLGKYVDERALPQPDCRGYLKVSWIPIHGE